MLLAVIGMAEAGQFAGNKLRYLPPLLDRYYEIFSIVGTEHDHPNPYFPFFHLKSEGFWHLRARPGRDSIVKAIDSARSHNAITENIDYVYLDDDLHQLLCNAETRQSLRNILVTRWFGMFTDQLSRPLSEDRYEKKLRNEVAGHVQEEPFSDYERSTRNVAFRRVVTEAYDYRCAATGLRVILPGDLVMVEAAHLIPFSESKNDDSRNGIALTPDFHWAMDRRIIAPGPDLKWHISKIVDERFADNDRLLQLAGKKVLLPKDEIFWPSQEALEHRMNQLLKEG